MIYIGDQIKKIRQRLEMPQSELARELGFKHAQQLNNIENGSAPFPLKKLDRLPKALGLSKARIKVMILNNIERQLGDFL